jgi:hypothetical protein
MAPNSRRFNLALDREALKKLPKEKGVKSLEDFNAFMWRSLLPA